METIIVKRQRKEVLIALILAILAFVSACFIELCIDDYSYRVLFTASEDLNTTSEIGYIILLAAAICALLATLFVKTGKKLRKVLKSLGVAAIVGTVLGCLIRVGILIDGLINYIQSSQSLPLSELFKTTIDGYKWIAGVGYHLNVFGFIAPLLGFSSGIVLIDSSYKIY